MSDQARAYTVVVAVDQIHTSSKAINHAFDLCGKLAVPYRLILLHALALNKPSHMPYLDDLDKACNADLKEQSRAAVASIHSFARRFEGRIDYTVETVEAYGDAGSVIDGYLREHHPQLDMLVVGTRNRQGVAK
ncbi:hypothetical protein SYNPS1DRAFT_22000 [Syncephalis pseudoplumigaleata]|uniref:UspA domain-containing protein n=1 Tax=Syncephalis pseudoplumigaleata TaxID=1712513 RepID=A0A4P9Z1G5_9FUNG|nr:hypothetical protein SYNPS1DRAFT_22000 [Syncephalis pseudoplumigaleata]|eukprot:RKP26178.1 hypothetical protein SYNPS1DRAFT_22000 [Syncephalis pseudoplumigaleata]